MTYRHRFAVNNRLYHAVKCYGPWIGKPPTFSGPNECMNWYVRPDDAPDVADSYELVGRTKGHLDLWQNRLRNKGLDSFQGDEK
jgi:hypothetical protein